jgi:transposase-like protein
VAYHWVSKFKKEGGTGSGMAEGEREPARLKRESERLGTESEFPRKAGAFFARSQRQRSGAC